MKHTYTYRGWYVFYYNSKYVAHGWLGQLEADSEDALLDEINEFMK